LKLYKKESAEENLKNLKAPNITIISSTSGIFGEAGHLDYSSTKSALMYGFMKTLKNEIVQFHPRGRVNTVAPGWVITPMSAEAMKDKGLFTKVYQTTALRKVATPEDVAYSILFLSSNKWSGHLSGEIIEVTGGMEGRRLYTLDQVQSFV